MSYIKITLYEVIYLKSFNSVGYQVRGIDRKVIGTAYTHGTVLRTQKALYKRGLVEFFGGFGPNDIFKNEGVEMYVGLTSKGVEVLESLI